MSWSVSDISVLYSRSGKEETRVGRRERRERIDGMKGGRKEKGLVIDKVSKNYGRCDLNCSSSFFSYTLPP